MGDHVMEIYDSDDDDLTVTSHGTPPTQKDKNFEFTNSHNMMRLFCGITHRPWHWFVLNLHAIANYFSYIMQGITLLCR